MMSEISIGGGLPIRKNRKLPGIERQIAGQSNAVSKNQNLSSSKNQNAAVSETLQRLMNRLHQAASGSQYGRQALQNGEGVLAEVRKNLGRIADLAQEAVSEGEIDRDALQSELEALTGEIDRLLKSAVFDGKPLFQDIYNTNNTSNIMLDSKAFANSLDALLHTMLQSESGALPDTDALPNTLPDWLLEGLTQNAGKPTDLLAALGLNAASTPEALLNALMKSDLNSSAAAGYLATLYLGAVIAGKGEVSESVSMSAILSSLQELLKLTENGMSVDDAIQELTDGAFESLLDFQNQFSGGTAPGMMDFISGLLLSGNSLDTLAEMSNSTSMLALLENLDGMNLDLLMGIFSDIQTSVLSLADHASAILTGAMPPGINLSAELTPGQNMQQTFGNFQVSGMNLSGVSYQEESGVLTISGDASVLVSGTAQAGQEIVLTDSAAVTLRSLDMSVLTIASHNAQVFSEGEVAIDTLVLQDGANITFNGKGLLDIGELVSGQANSIRLLSGAVLLDGGEGVIDPSVLVLVDAPASLAAQAEQVYSLSGKQLEPMDILWQTFLPNWSSLSMMAMDGRQASMQLMHNAVHSDVIRLWLDKQVNPHHGYPCQRVSFAGKDIEGKNITRYAYLRWDERNHTFQEVVMYPNPFVISGGVENQDWSYDESTQTLHILSEQVTALSGGVGTDAEEQVFSGRIALQSHIEAPVALVLDNVDCRVVSGRALDLGRDNDVTLLLAANSENYFSGGYGCAGISLPDGAKLCIDIVPVTEETENADNPEQEAYFAGFPENQNISRMFDDAARNAADRENAEEQTMAEIAEEELLPGMLTAVGGNGGAGIGRDGNGSWDRISEILIRGGRVYASGGGAGAGIGAGKYGFMGTITITGGEVTAVGGPNGGAGIGGALGAPVGDILIQGGDITAEASYHAAAIGAGIQGESGDIYINGTARILRATGGDPGADIGSCIFGKCGEIQIADGIELNNASVKPWVSEGIPLSLDDESLILPQFTLSTRALLLDQLHISTRKQAWTAKNTVRSAERRLNRIQKAYSELCNQLERNINSIYHTQETVNAAGLFIRDGQTAQLALSQARELILQKSQDAVRIHDQELEDILRLLREYKSEV